MPFIERFEPQPDSNENHELVRAANKLKLISELDENEKIFKQKCQQWIALKESKTIDTATELRLQFEINVYGSAVAQAKQAELELLSDIESLGVESP